MANTNIFDILFPKDVENQRFIQDTIALQQFQRQQQLVGRTQLPSGIAGPVMPPPQFPIMRSQRGASVANRFFLEQQQITGRPVTQPTIADQRAAAAAASGFPPGSPGFERIATGPLEPKVTQTTDTILNPKTGKAERIRSTFTDGILTRQETLGEATLAEKLGGVSPEIFTQLQRPVATKIQTELKDAEIDIANLKSIRNQFRPEFTEIPFKIGAAFTAFQEKVGGLLGKPSVKAKRELTEFSAWRRDAQREFVVFKKWATGVAAGQKEMTEQIQTAFPSAMGDSATQFVSKLDSAIKVRERTRDILTDILNSGTVLTVRDKKDAERGALRQALSEEFRQQPVSPLPFTPEQIEAELRRRGIK